MTGERQIAAPRETVWAALNDPEVLRACIPGCETLEQTAPNELAAEARVKIGPMSARFAGTVTLSDLDPPNGYSIAGQGQGGAAGFAKGGADVRLIDREGGTLLSYEVKAQVGGKMAQIGARLIDGTAKSLAEQFFTRFVAEVEGPGDDVADAEAPTEDAEVPSGNIISRMWKRRGSSGAEPQEEGQ